MKLDMQKGMTGILVLTLGFIFQGCSDDGGGGSTSFESEADGSGFELQLDAGSGSFAPGPEGGGESSTGGPSFLDTSVEPPSDAETPGEGDVEEGSEGSEQVDAEGSESVGEGGEYSEEGELAITLQTDGEILSGISSLEAVVTGGEWILGVEFHVDGLKVDTDVVPPYTLALDTKAFEDGPHVLEVFTADSQGAYASDYAEVLFDNSPPAFEEVVPGDASTVFFEDGPLNLSVVVDEPDKIVEMKMRVNGLLVGEYTQPPFEVSVAMEDIFVDATDLPKTLFVQLSATDVLGQVTEQSFNTQVHSRLRWKFDMVYEVKGSPGVFPNGNVVFGNNGGELYSFTPDGQEAWKANVGYQISDGVQVDPETGNVYFGTIGEGNQIYGFNSGGSQIWSQSHPDQSPASGRITVGGGSVYALLFNGRVLAMDKNSGSEVWSVLLPDNIVGSPAVAPSGRVYAGCLDSRFRAVESSGVIWDFTTGDEVRSTAAIGSQGVVYFASNDGYLYAANESDGSHVWATEIEGNIEGEILLVEEESALYVPSSSGYLYRVNANTGDIQWESDLQFMADSSPVRGEDGTIYVASQVSGAGTVFAIDPQTGAQFFSYPADGVVRDKVLVVGDKVYFGSESRAFFSIWANHANLFVPEESEGTE